MFRQIWPRFHPRRRLRPRRHPPPAPALPGRHLFPPTRHRVWRHRGAGHAGRRGTVALLASAGARSQPALAQAVRNVR
eukprot:scaffold28611_cov67-Isochrysis_galbana.AAC.1